MYVGNQQSAGMLRYNTQSHQLEVYDGNNWLSFGSGATVGLSPEAEQILSWGREKMREEHELEKLMKDHPGLKELHEKFLLMKALVARESKKPWDQDQKGKTETKTTLQPPLRRFFCGINYVDFFFARK